MILSVFRFRLPLQPLGSCVSSLILMFIYIFCHKSYLPIALFNIAE